MRKRWKKLEAGDIKLLFIPVRYIILLAIVLSISVIYRIFAIATVFPVFFVLKLLFGNVSLVFNPNILNQIIIIQGKTIIELIPACIAGSAYLFLLALNLTVPMERKKRIFSITMSILIFLGINILRIVVFSAIYHLQYPYLDFTHKLFWYLLSTIFVIGIWFFVVKIYSINEIPVLTDLKFIYSKILKKQ